MSDVCVPVFQRDFLSIELVEGRVRLTFELGSGPLPLTSTRAYNTGVWYKITLQRNKRKGEPLSSLHISWVTCLGCHINPSSPTTSPRLPVSHGC